MYGVPIVAQRKVNYGRIDPEARRICPASSRPNRNRRTVSRSSPAASGR
ncbi:hypothetical protein ABT040_45145 [Streptomyces sp. NPDC002688]